MLGEISGMLSLMSASVFKALSRAALLAPSRSVVLPVTMRPSPSSMATAGPPVSSALSLAALNARTDRFGDVCLRHDQLDLFYDFFAGASALEIHAGLIQAADDLLGAGHAGSLVIDDAVSRHIDAHIGRGTVWAFPVDRSEHGAQDREDLYIAVVIDRGLAIGFQMEWVDHVDVIEGLR